MIVVLASIVDPLIPRVCLNQPKFDLSDSFTDMQVIGLNVRTQIPSKLIASPKGELWDNGVRLF